MHADAFEQMFARSFDVDSFAPDYRGYRWPRALPDETPKQTRRRLRKSEATIAFVESIVATNADNMDARAGLAQQGIIPALQRRFYPTTTLQSLTGTSSVQSSSSTTIGSGVDQHMVQFARACTLPPRCHRFARWVAEFCRVHNFYPLAAQMGIQVGTRWTAADLVCLNNNTGRLVVFELKTGYDRFYTAACSRQPALSFFPSVPNTWQAHHLLQLSTMVHALMRPPYNAPADAIEGYVLRVNQTHGVCRPIAVPEWFDAPLVFEMLTLPISKVRTRWRRFERERERQEREQDGCTHQTAIEL